MICFSSPFDTTAVDFLESLNVPAYKIASFEITDIPLIEYVASKGKPIILSTGIAEIEDIELAIDACKRMGNDDIALLKCTSSYPAPIEEANMIMVQDLATRFGVISGLSDHTMGATVPVVATCFGAKIIEKHFKVKFDNREIKKWKNREMGKNVFLLNNLLKNTWLNLQQFAGRFASQDHTRGSFH